MSKKGIDVSEWQGVINWDKVKNSGIEFAILRLGWIGNKNNHTLDKYFERNFTEAKRVGIPIGIYVYCYSNSIANIQNGAKWVVEKLKGKSLELPVYIDMEDSSIVAVGKNTLTDMCFKFNEIIEKAGYWAGVYANKNWFTNYLDKDRLGNRFTLWVAQYTKSCTLKVNNLDIWQHTSSGAVDGIAGKVDMNIMYRDLLAEIKPVSKPATKSIDQLVQETLAGKHGDDEVRKKSLGVFWQPVQDIINAIYRKDKTYIVKRGDTLSGIAKKYKTTWQKIYNDNKAVIGKDPNKIKAGQKLIIKK